VFFAGVTGFVLFEDVLHGASINTETGTLRITGDSGQ
jgi:hypothetical protein